MCHLEEYPCTSDNPGGKVERAIRHGWQHYVWLLITLHLCLPLLELLLSQPAGGCQLLAVAAAVAKDADLT